MSQAKKVRLTIDLDAQQHAMLKMAAARRGISMRQLVIENLSNTPNSKDVNYVDDETFEREFRKSMRKHGKILKELADK